MGDSGDSSSASDCGSPQPKGRSINKVFVWLKEKANCTPRGNPWVLLNREGRVKDVAIQGNYSSAKMKELVKENFVGLAAVDLNRIRLYKSANRGSRIEKVYKGIPDAKELLRIYGRGRANSRRIYMVLHRPRNGGSNTNPQSRPTPGVSNPNHPSPSLQTNPNFDVASLHPSTSQSQLSPPPAQPNSNPPSTNQSQPSLPPAQPDSNPPSTNQSQPSLPSAQPNSNPPSTNHFQPSLPPARPNSNPPLLSRQSTTHQNPSQSQTSVTNSVIQPETSSGATSAASGVVGLVDLTLPAMHTPFSAGKTFGNQETKIILCAFSHSIYSSPIHNLFAVSFGMKSQKHLMQLVQSLSNQCACNHLLSGFYPYRYKPSGTLSPLE